MKIKFVLFERTIGMIKELHVSFFHIGFRWDIAICLMCK